jgi:hypothetical protein
VAKEGRPTVMTPEVLKKLEEAFAIGASDREACFYADISDKTLYNYQSEHPEFVQRKEALKERPVLLARQKVVEAIKEDVKNAQWYLERRSSDFKPKQDITSDDKQITGYRVVFVDKTEQTDDSGHSIDQGTQADTTQGE